MAKTVLHLIHSGGFYGAEAVVLNLSIGLRDLGVRSIIGCFMNEGDEKPALGLIAEAKGIDVEYISFRRKIDFDVIWRIRHIVKLKKVSILHSHGYKASFYCFLLFVLFNIQYVITCHLWTRETRRAYFYVLMEKVSMIFSRRIIAVSHPIGNKIGTWNMLKKKLIVIPNAIDISLYDDYVSNFDPKILRQQIGLKNETIIVGTLGRLVYQKAHEYLIEAASEIYRTTKLNVEFFVAGDGHRRNFLEKMTVDYNIDDRFHFIGFRHDSLNILRIIDVFVLCSIDEGLPIVLLEAMSLGKPIIVTRVGEIPRIVRNNYNGILVDPKNVDHLVVSIKRLMEDKDFTESIGQAAKDTIVNNFSIGKMADLYNQNYSCIN